ncbi:hypothetical protein ACHAXS_007025 [Conticribra weissflogii]
MMFPVSAFSSLILHFDGSFRPPPDPVPGYISICDAKSDDVMFSSCGAAIFLGSDSLFFGRSTPNEYKENLIALGGKNLPLVQGTTSTDVEYDGLLFGLDWVIRVLSHENIMRDDILLHSTIIVRGDCKTVIDQLNSRSAARKMESKYCMAVSRIKEIENLYNLHRSHSAQSTMPQEVRFHFDHIQRENNSLCDAICKLVVNQKQRCVVASIIDSIKTGESNASRANNNRNSKRRSFKKPKKVTSPENSCFQTAIQEVSSRRLPLCHSSAIALACMLTEAAIRTSDPVALYHMSSFFLRTSRRWDRVYYLQNYSVDHIRQFTADKYIDADKETFRKLGLIALTMSMKMWGFKNDAEALAKKNKINSGIIEEEINAILKAILSHSTNVDANLSEISENTVEARILSPYEPISEVVNTVTALSLRSALIRWNALAVAEELRDHGLWLVEKTK